VQVLFQWNDLKCLPSTCRLLGRLRDHFQRSDLLQTSKILEKAADGNVPHVWRLQSFQNPCDERWKWSHGHPRSLQVLSTHLKFSRVTRIQHAQRFNLKKVFKSGVTSSGFSTDGSLRVIRNVLQKYTSQWQKTGTFIDLELRVGEEGGRFSFACPAGFSSYCDFFLFCPK